MNRRKLILALTVGVGILLAGCGTDSGNSNSGDSSGASEDTTYSIWVGKAEDASYYMDYHDNPILQEYYLKQEYLGQDGEQVTVDVEFQVPAAGSEADNCNTLIATGDYTDVMDMSFYNGSVLDLYNEGVALDITEYVENYMPNYLKFLDSHPELAMTASNIIDGEKKYIKLYGYNTSTIEFQGLCYRRDWIVKYGKNPVTGEAFSGDYLEKNDDGTVNTDSWSDDVVFPSGGSDPVYISDWEWMFEIFDVAMEDLGITDGYCISLYYQGFSGLGVMESAFGGGTPSWHLDGDTIQFGGDSEDFRVYLQCMSEWYQNGWIDKAFAEHTGVLPWRVDESNVRQGKVGAWLGLDSQLMGRLDSGDEYNKDSIVYAASYPINDIYGTDAQKNNAPFCIYQNSDEGKAFIVTDKALEKDIVALFSFIDKMYEEENALKNKWGFSADEYVDYRNDFYDNNGLENGAYYDSGTTDSDGRKVYYLEENWVKDSGNLQTAVAFQRFLGLVGESSTSNVIDGSRTETYKHQKYLWEEVYKNSGVLSTSLLGQMSVEDSKVYYSIQTNVNEFMQKNVPSFINGTKDPYSDSDWEAYVNALNKYNPDGATVILQGVIDLLK